MKLEERGVYRIKSRNLQVGVFDGETGFIGIRNKFDNQYLFTEHLFTPTSGTVHPIRLLTHLPDQYALAESLGSRCVLCNKRARWTGPPAPAPWNCEGGCPDPAPAGVPNADLHNFLLGVEAML